ncbi:hypothetical protein [Oscillibacter sp.]|uniref:hypothetical protein n=1 Tax=Oscillibacter sp. TaxID=1945593 RepID=UPI002D7FCFA5|nr:hypothetical protein [Oscillibacter sp.]
MLFADDWSCFSEEYQYILICGSAMPQQKLMNEYLSYIPWRGVVSLSTNLHEPLNAEIGSVKHLRALQSTQSEAECTDTIQHSAVWWLYSNGYDDDPDTLTDSFAQWRNRNRRFLQYTVQEICTAAPPQELMIIMDCGSLEGEGEWNKVQALLEYFDENEDSGTQAAVLNAENQRSFDQNRLANLRLRAFPLGIESLADYAASYLNGSRRAGVWLPHRDKKTGIQLEEADEQYITSYVDIVGDHLLDPSVPSRALRAFYRGEPITWDAIDRALPVLHPRTAALAEEIRQRIDEEKWGRIKVPHTPGAGASVLTRTVCWQLRKSCPVVQLREVNMDTLECLQRVAALSRCPVLILMDGDFTISDVEAVESNMHSGIASKKYLILYTYRVYGASDDMRKLSVLDDRTAEDFERHYAEELKQSEIYPLDEISTRTANLGELTRTQTFREFRLPFFYGMYAFEEDFVSVSHYINQVLDFMNRDAKYYKAIRYLSLVTYFTGTKGLSFKILKKLLSMNSSSLAEIRKTLNAGIPSLVYTTNASYRICHPVIAYQILLKTCGEGTGHLSTLSFCKLCTEFIKDIRKLDRSDDPSAYVNQLVADLFTNREVIDHEATARDASRSSFSTAILALGQFNLQKEVFQCLVENFPKNAHCFQHYGRLLSVNEPLNLMPAKQQFNEAIQLDPESPLHYHARGTMYLRFCRQKLHSDSLKTPEDIYNECKSAVELALQDFFTTLDYARYTPLFNRSYPYSSILQICTIVIKQIIRRYDERYPGTKFWDSGTEIARWCHHLLSVARRYAMRTEIEHPEFEQNPYYAQMKRDLTGIKFSLPELEALIEKSPTENADLKIIYLSRLNTRREAWRFRTQQDLATITEYCETVTQIIGPDGGVLWKWFQAYIRMDNFSYAHALGFLENLPGLENSVTVNYLLQILYFCQFYETANPDDADKALFYQRRCRELSQTAINGDHRRSCRLFLTAPGTGRVPLTDLREDGAKLECTVIDQVAKEQSARMTLKLDPRFKAVFVPIYNQEVKTRQGFGLPVKAAIGFSYNGLYGFDLEIGHD